jgi:hypothetical protein
MLSSEELSLYGTIGALESWARTEDRSARTAPARNAFLARFEDYADPASAKRAYFLRLAQKSADARRRKKAS